MIAAPSLDPRPAQARPDGRPSLPPRLAAGRPHLFGRSAVTISASDGVIRSARRPSLGTFPPSDSPGPSGSGFFSFRRRRAPSAKTRAASPNFKKSISRSKGVSVALVRFVDDMMSSPASNLRDAHQAQGIDRMRTKIARFRTAEDTLDAVRPVLERMVAGEEHACGSRMTAYARVSRDIGKSPSWIRKMIGRQAVGLALRDALNIARAYDALCARVEKAAELETARADALRRMIDETLDRTARLVARAEEAPPEPTDP